MIFGLMATYYLARQQAIGFLFAVIGSTGWVTFGILTGSIASVLANICFISINLYGYYRWKSAETPSVPIPRGENPVQS